MENYYDISIVVAVSLNGVIGNEGKIPWKLKSDLDNFRRLTSGKIVVMGRKTYESIGRPLNKRRNIVLTSNKDYRADGCETAASVMQVLDLIEDNETFVIGGQEVYRQFMPMTSRMYVTTVQCYAGGDTYFSFDPDDWNFQESRLVRAKEGDDLDYNYSIYGRIRK